MTNGTDERQGGAWIGQHPDENTEKVRENLPEGAERVAVTNNEADGTQDGGAPQGGRDDVREAGEKRGTDE